MAQHDKDPADNHEASETAAGDVWTTTSVDHPVESERVEPQANSAPGSAPAPKPPRKNWHRFTLFAATLGLLATAGAIAAYRFRDKHEKLAAFATVVDEAFARPEKLVSALRENVVKWTGKAAKPAETAKAPAPIDLGAIETTAPPKPAPIEAKPAEPAPPPRANGERVTTWSSPATPAPVPAPVAAPEPPAKPVTETKPETETKAASASSSEQTEALARRVDELERIARSALALAEEARISGEATRAAPKVQDQKAPDQKAPDQKVQDVEDNVSGLEGRIDWLAERLDELREKLETSKNESRVAREAEPVPAPQIVAPQAAPEEAPKGPDPATIVVVAHSLQRALDRGTPFASEYAVLSAHGADSEALSALAPSAEKGAPDARALRASFHPLIRKLEASAELKPDAPLADRLLQGASKLVKVRTATEKEKATIGDTAAKLEAALDRGEIEAALAAFAEFPDDAKAVAREWEEAARRRVAAEKAAASILSGALDALAKTKN
ncbi:hypothetical protein IY145_09540 [Methylosinus sp. H3A]|uniref:COG4223 family protein n=1 Tax=Methylosinus sp. H3A TaxID=2785786 RepID=UPI0018C34F9C|nr:hypothetical protein [Methylosinus sp. H3A]MBG0809621.1 hypothetical protein [Methylosinus sp. H3A]